MALETILHRARVNLRETLRLGRYRWYWRLRTRLAALELVSPAWRIALAEAEDDEDCTYGETPLLTAWEILRDLEVTPQDTVVDLGCGRGQVLAVADMAYGCRTVGVETLPGLVRLARQLGADVREADFRDEVPEGTVYFLSPTALCDESWSELQAQLADRPPGTKAAVLSAPLPGWQVLDERPRAFSWGMCQVYLLKRE